MRKVKTQSLVLWNLTFNIYSTDLSFPRGKTLLISNELRAKAILAVSLNRGGLGSLKSTLA